ncbi:triosephosphate isomerase [Sphingomonas jinjuensis]|uniref:Triosephosphate isomerase n=1 Tax=Sphingomonas jinjuensis TaxID=535907 RepID=A0A840F350_9SPHN|nr:triose-phosphate isomerase [Sphingomonas jinjuensis]MBB4152239.1 triosephosphate isomerase [Sphingomonas jinjuensis]
MLVIGNWKMHGDRQRLAEVVAIDRHVRRGCSARVALCVPATLIAAARGSVEAVVIGAQDCHQAVGGAFTGRLSASMLADAGAQMVVVGHSECRAAGDDDAAVGAKVTAAIGAGLEPVLCVGETSAERDEGLTAAVVVAQARAALPGRVVEGLALAYEPVWAIGSGRLPQEGDIAAVIAALRRCLVDLYGVEGSDVPILYGGSVSAANAAALLGIDGIGGLLVGSASLSADSFVPILAAAG